MSHESESEKLSRRGFLKNAAVLGGAATATALGSQVQAGVEGQAPAAKEVTPPKGYRETPHIREYYKKARF